MLHCSYRIVKASIRPLHWLAFAAGLAFVWPSFALAENYFARFTFGSYLSSEEFSNPLDGQAENSFVTVSSRMYLRVSQLSSANLDVVADVRDKNDFFEKLDAERLQLTNGNTLQIRQLSVRDNNESGSLYGEFGRFPVPEAGDVNCDGVQTGVRWNQNLRTSLFGGLNSKRPDQTYVQYNPDSSVYGLFTLFQPQNQGWNRSMYVSNALVANEVSGHLDRLYYYNNFTYSWSAPNQVIGLVYLDFTPRVYAQTALLTWHQEESPRVATTVSFTGIDAIAYSRQQGILTQLPSSPYREGGFNLRQTVNRGFLWDYNASYGIRDVDGLHKTELSTGPVFPLLFNPHFSGKASLGYRYNFTAVEDFAKFGISYFSRDWEVSYDQELGYRLEETGLYYHPDIEEVTVSKNLSRALYASVSIERATMETVSIISGFFKIGFRAGSKDVPPLRDGAPPPGGNL